MIKHSISKKMAQNNVQPNILPNVNVSHHQKLPVSYVSSDGEKNIHRTSILVPPCHCEPPEGKVRGRYGGFSPSSNLSGCGAMAFLSTRSLQGDMHAICRGDGLFPRGKKWEKNVFQFAFFCYCWKATTSIRRGKKCSQPAQTNPAVGLPFFTNSKTYQEPSSGRQ